MHIVRSNGWQRLWVVASVCSLLPAAAFVLLSLQLSDQIEDATFHSQRLANDVIVAEIAGVGEVRFPDDLTSDEIGSHVKRGMSTSPPSVASIAEGLRDLRAQRAAAIARAENRLARSANQTVWIVGVAGWVVFVVGLYVSGWAIAWVRRGFHAP
jgi:hypothetical protein